MAQFTFEDIDQHINSLDLGDFRPGGRHHFAAEAVASSPGDVLKKLCVIYRGIRPILITLENFPLIPATWREAIKTFTALMDTLCPST